VNFHPRPVSILVRRTFVSLIAGALVLSAGAALGGQAKAAGSTPSGTTLTSSLNPANYDDRVVFDVFVSDQSDACHSQANCVSPLGTVVFGGFGHAGNTVEINTHAVSPGWSEVTYETARGDLGKGTYTVTAAFQGSPTFAASQDSIVQTVNTIASTSTSLGQDHPSSIPGQSVTFTAEVTPGDGGEPSGQVQFYEGGSPYGGPVSVGYDSTSGTSIAQLTTTTLSGTQTFVARYLADSSYDTSVSDQVSHSVVSPSVSVNLFSEINPSVAGQGPVRFYVSVYTNNPGAPDPTGTVTVYLNGNPVEQGTINASDQYEVDISFDIGLGDNNMTANYAGDATYPPTGSGTLDQVVNRDSTTTTLASSVNPSAPGQAVTFTSTTLVVAPGPYTPTGSVTFFDSSTVTSLGTAPLGAGGHATLTTTSLAAGTHAIQALYSADTNCSASNSSVLDQSVAVAPLPTVSAVSPRAGSTAGGTPITITGSHFVAPAHVHVGGVAATKVVVVSATKITATTPAHAAGTVNVQVFTAAGSNALSSTDYYAYGAPTVTALSSHSGPSAGGTVLTVTGTGFVAGDTVRFGAVAGTGVTVLSTTQLRVTAPAGPAGSTANVTVTSPAGTSATSPADAYSYMPLPTVSAVGPRAGSTAGGTSITITGSHFVAPATVHVGGLSATQVVVVSPTQITAKTPAHAAGAVNVQVFTSAGSNALSSADYYAYGAPTVTALSTHSGSSAGGTVLTVTGTGFVAGDTVSFGGAAGTGVTVLSTTQLRVTSPARPAGTVANVTVANPSGASATSAADAYTYQASPTVTAVGPRAGSTAGGTSITITGTNFTAPATVGLGGTAATNVVVVSSTQITARTSARVAGTVDVRVTTGGGPSTQSSADYYAYGAPTVTALSTHSGSTAGGTVLIVTGTGFVAGDTVRFGTVAGASVTVLSTTQLRVTAPAGPPGSTANVTVTNPAGTSTTSAADMYSYT
jgi:hypothetical protein